MSTLKRSLLLIFLLATALSIVAFNLQKPRILVLHSYDHDYSWSRDVSVGIRRILDQKPQYAVRWFYMDTKRHPWPDYKENIAASARRTIDHWKPDIVIAVDDDAQQYVMRHYLDTPLRIVFSGVNGEPADYGYDRATNATGILERKALDFLKETLITLQKQKADRQPLRIVHVGDRSESVASDDRLIAGFDWQPLQRRDSILVDSFDAWQQAINEAGKHADIILTSNYRKLKRSATDTRLVPAKEIVAWSLAHSAVPIIGTNGFFVEDGGYLAIGTSPFEQGEVAAGIAVAMLEKNQPTQSLPVLSTRQFVVYMRGHGLEQYGFRLPPLYESFARATNNYFE